MAEGGGATKGKALREKPMNRHRAGVVPIELEIALSMRIEKYAELVAVAE
jgi:hypothetical protein